MSVSNIYYEVLHSLEDEGLLDPSDSIHMFCAQHVFLPRLQRDLNVFRVGWDNHPLRTEQNLSPQQLWTVGLLQNSFDDPDLAEEIEDLDFNPGSEPNAASSGVIVPPIVCPLHEQDMARLWATIDVTGPSESHGRDIYLTTLNYVQNCVS